MTVDKPSAWNKAKPHLLAIIAMVVVCIAYFFPQLQGKKIQAGDAISSTAWSSEVIHYGKETGRTIRWNNAIFSGMPWGLLTLGAQYNVTKYAVPVIQAGFKGPLGLTIRCALLCYLALILLGISPWLAVIGSLGFAINVNFIVLLDAGHHSKLAVISSFPLIVAGLILCFRQQYILGACAIAFASSLAILSNHIQMVYYLLLSLVLLALSYLIDAIRKGEVKTFAIASGVALGAALLTGLANFAQLSSSNDYADDTMRGQPILTKASAVAESSSEVEGLEWNYAMSWSNEFTDVLSILIPRIVGGSSGEEISANSELGRLLRSNNAPVAADGTVQAPLYWGTLTFTSGPYYLGAIMILLFVFSLFQVNPALRWGMIAVTLLLFFLSMGQHASWLNRPLFDHLPLFSKFRTPNSVMNVLPAFIVIPAMLGLQKVFTGDRQKLLTDLFKSVAIVGGFCLVFALIGGELLSFRSVSDERYPANILSILVNARKSAMQADAFRSLAFCLAGAGVLWAILKYKITSTPVAVGLLTLLVTIDLWTVDRRYIDASDYASTSEYSNNLAERPVDSQIKQMEPNGRGYYRVLDLSISTFNSAHSSYHHNTIGGYHAAKLQRYQDLIDRYLSKGQGPVLNMLNGKYIITRDQQLSINQQALGNAWFVNDIQYVNTPNEEIDALASINPAQQAVVLKDEFAETLDGFTPGNGSGTIALVDYVPDHLTYKTNSSTPQLAIFSETWYGPDKGWKVTIDGNPANMIRANYILRGLVVPAGEHEIVFSFQPHAKGSTLSLIASLLLLLGCVVGGIQVFRQGEFALAESPVLQSAPVKKRRVKTKSKRKKR